MTNGNRLFKMLATGSRNELRYQNGALRIRRLSPAGDLTNHAQFADSQNGATIFYNGTANSSDSRLKDNQLPMSTKDAWEILNAVQAKTYTRNDQGGAPKFGFIAQEMEAAVQGKANFECLVGSTEGDDEEPSMKTLDYSRLTAILWTCVKDLHSRVQELQSVVDSLPNH